MSRDKKILFVIGGLLMLIGSFVYSKSAIFAAQFLQANIIFNMPWAEKDVEKVGIIALIGIIIFIVGLIFLISGFLKDTNKQNSFGTPITDENSISKWNALVKYDEDIASAVTRLKPLGKKWLEEFALSYLAINDKQYILEIEKKILAAAEKDALEEEQRTVAILRKREEENEHFKILAEEKRKKREEQEREREHNPQKQTTEYLYEEQEQVRKEYIQTWKSRIFGKQNVIVIASILTALSIITIIGISLWQKNLNIEEEKSRIASDRSKIDEARRKNEELEQQVSYEKELIANEKRSIDESQRTPETVNNITNTPYKYNNYQSQSNHINEQPSNSQTSNASSIPVPSIKVGDNYTYESVDSDNQKSKVTTKRTVISAGDEIVFSTINIGSKKAKPRNLCFNREWNLISTRNAENGGLDYSPPLKYYDFPLYPNKTWQQTTTETDIKTGKTRIHTITGTVGQWEDVTVPAGTFRAIRVNLGTDVFNPITGAKINGTDTSWYVPEVHRSVKSIGTGKDGKQQVIQLLRYEVK